jgi:predicted enzyme related to lactoylglutathione lyase
MGNPVVHWELWSKEPQRAAAFYEEVFDWKIQHVPELDYRMVETGGVGGINGGIMRPQEGPWPGNMAFYIGVDELAPYREKIVAAGGRIVVERMEVPGMGAFALFADPDGRVLGIWQPAGGEEAR